MICQQRQEEIERSQIHLLGSTMVNNTFNSSYQNLTTENEVIDTENGKYFIKNIPLIRTRMKINCERVLEQSSNVEWLSYPAE